MTKKGLDSAPESQEVDSGTTKVALEQLKAEFQNKSPDIVKKMKEAKNMLKSTDKLNFKDYEGKFKQSQADINSLGDKLNAENAKVKDSSNTELNSLLQELSNEHKLLVATFKGLDKPESLKKTKEPYLIQNGPKSAFMDIELTVDKIKEISVKELIAIHGNIRYFIVEVPGHGTQVLRINDGDGGDELALLDVNEIKKENDNEDDFREKVYNRIDTAEITRAGNAFRDIEVDGVNLYNSGTDALGEGILTGLGAGSLIAGGVAGLSKLSATAGAATKAFAFCKIITAGATLTTGAIAGTAAGVGLVAGGTAAAFTDVDLTTERAKKYGLTAKLDNIDKLTPKPKV